MATPPEAINRIYPTSPSSRVVAVVGTDGAGKSTVTRAAEALLGADGWPVRRVECWDVATSRGRYPAARFLRDDVADMRARVATMPPGARFLFLMWSLELALAGRAGDPDAGEIVLVDGHWAKHAAAEVAYGLDREWVEHLVGGLAPAALTIHLRVDPEGALGRKRGDLIPYECGMDPACADASFLAHQRVLQEIMLGWSSRDGWVDVDANRPPEEVVAEVVATVTGTWARERRRSAGGA